jgi:hypothetical protein
MPVVFCCFWEFEQIRRLARRLSSVAWLSRWSTISPWPIPLIRSCILSVGFTPRSVTVVAAYHLPPFSSLACQVYRRISGQSTGSMMAIFFWVRGNSIRRR